ncbi:MAG: NADH-quinone oxidoreductase subunit C [Acidimicrobiia bacterium]|nr:NADH-quinone oxidoreductase subunit C [Acidimicrobiia bacterium]
MAEESLTLTRLRDKFPEAILETHSFRGDDTAIVRPEALVAIATCLKNDPALDYSYLMDLTAVDCLNLGTPHRFEVVYHFFSLSKKHRVRIKIPLGAKNPQVNSIASLWPGADWYEREVWDMFGVQFIGHPNLKRILLYEEFQGHPLRKDYPVDKRQPLIGPGSPGQPLSK